MEFDDECDRFVQKHRQLRSDSRLRRISSGLGHAEITFLRNVWWPMFHSFENLHPEYEIRDYKDGNRYIDFAYILPHFRLAIEIDGLSTHWREITQEQFEQHNQRQNMLIIDGWYLLRFTYETVNSHPRICEQAIQQLLGRWQGNSSVLRQLSMKEREIAGLAVKSPRPITAADVSQQLGISTRYARTLLKGLTEKRWLVPATGHIRHTSYHLHESKMGVRW
ncbi:hypothetical protein [Alicyclobacillus ferrooxydans]|uniref:DUF559 domain-containing protein n=1 Tax=Alicyclobacillus ferrooxydans TaxID=471514 RepID=A0A0N8PP57_9BACL|nr:hypothetical protein [Alicyclobacillus ferrooxydans]KPV43397.1 hypothetical protein AN477_12390 [Alicyclobacillus ferrooxydans]